MTPDLEKRWKAGDKPFDGKVVTSSTDSSMETILKVMQIFLEEVVTPSEEIFIFDDWHEHDGFITESKKISVENLASKIADSDALKASTNGEYEVRTSVYSTSNDWLMRWCIDLEDNAYCDFEFCCSKSFGSRALDLMYSINPSELNQSLAKEYFDRAYGG